MKSTTKKAAPKKRAAEKKVDLTPEDGSAWEFSIGYYPGILFGMRTYQGEDINIHVLYIPFVDLVLRVAK